MSSLLHFICQHFFQCLRTPGGACISMERRWKTTLTSWLPAPSFDSWRTCLMAWLWNHWLPWDLRTPHYNFWWVSEGPCVSACMFIVHVYWCTYVCGRWGEGDREGVSITASGKRIKVEVVSNMMKKGLCFYWTVSVFSTLYLECCWCLEWIFCLNLSSWKVWFFYLHWPVS